MRGLADDLLQDTIFALDQPVDHYEPLQAPIERKSEISYHFREMKSYTSFSSKEKLFLALLCHVLRVPGGSRATMVALCTAEAFKVLLRLFELMRHLSSAPLLASRL